MPKEPGGRDAWAARRWRVERWLENLLRSYPHGTIRSEATLFSSKLDTPSLVRCRVEFAPKSRGMDIFVEEVVSRFILSPIPVSSAS